MALKRRTKVEASFIMSSMTDLIFLLLIFFVLASTMSAPNDIKMLDAYLCQVQAQDSTMYIALHADQDIAYKEVVRVLDIANQHHMKLVVATKK